MRSGRYRIVMGIIMIFLLAFIVPLSRGQLHLNVPAVILLIMLVGLSVAYWRRFHR